LFILQDVYFNPQWQQSRSLILRLRGAELGRQDFCFYHTMFKTIFSGHNKILGGTALECLLWLQAWVQKNASTGLSPLNLTY